MLVLLLMLLMLMFVLMQLDAGADVDVDLEDEVDVDIGVGVGDGVGAAAAVNVNADDSRISRLMGTKRKHLSTNIPELGRDRTHLAKTSRDWRKGRRSLSVLAVRLLLEWQSDYCAAWFFGRWVLILVWMFMDLPLLQV